MLYVTRNRHEIFCVILNLHRHFSQQTFLRVVVEKAGVTNNLRNGSSLVKSPSKPWKCKNEPACTIPGLPN